MEKVISWFACTPQDLGLVLLGFVLVGWFMYLILNLKERHPLKDEMIKELLKWDDSRTPARRIGCEGRLRELLAKYRQTS